MPDLKTGVLYYGDNLDILRGYIPAESVDLIYLDPPFNSQQQYNVLFKEPTGQGSTAQIRAFTDTWHWDDKDRVAERTYSEIISKAPLKVSKAIEALRNFIGSNDVMAYLVMMTLRLVELHRVLKPTGSLYLHCDPTASHYLKVILDTIFGPKNFRNEIVWKRTTSHGDAKQGARHFGRVSDTILFYVKGDKAIWNTQFMPFSDEQVKQQYYKVNENGRNYRLVTPTAKKPGGDTSYEWKGVLPPKGRYWAYTREKMAEMDKSGLLYYSKTGQPYIKYYLDERPGVAAQSNWSDISPMGPTAKERLGFQTQKPLALLERIISASSNEGDVVLDPFCGCGTAIIAAQKLNRRWIGIDVTHLAITVMRKRLEDSFPGIKYEVIGEPKDLEGAKALARQDRYQFQFQWWALSLVNALPQGGERKKGADEGIDGVISFVDDRKGKASRVIVQVKSGHVGVRDIRELKAVIGDENLGLFITLEPPTEPMRVEAATAGFHSSPLWERELPRIQIFTVAELLGGKKPELPGKVSDFARALRLGRGGRQMAMSESSE
jgi:site-specific DNA-methyltransferase (adenine-specific)